MSPLDAGVHLALADPASLTGLQKKSEQRDTLNIKGRQQSMDKKNYLCTGLVTIGMIRRKQSGSICREEKIVTHYLTLTDSLKLK